ncbi:MAG: UMP kinase [Chitinispirillales bacterium]|jgi:uridylate kinase|nr:UMP kinase [Chitinispirillales bacterium]
MGKYKRILLKLSGEALAGETGFGVSSDILLNVAQDIKQVAAAGIEVAVVIGGGNIFRGMSAAANGFNRTAGDNVGMLATIINSIMLAETLKKIDIDARVMNSFQVDKVAEYFVAENAIRHLQKKRVVIVSGGTGNPFFTTDTAAALRCAELNCDVFFKATKVDGIYDKDPMKYKDAVKFNEITHSFALEKRLKIMDSAAFSLCLDNNVEILVFELLNKGNIFRAVNGENVGTAVKKG